MGKKVTKEKISNNWINLTFPLSRFVLLASLVHAQTAPSPAGAEMQVIQMLGRRRFAARAVLSV
jgi:hypothetical protein